MKRLLKYHYDAIELMAHGQLSNPDIARQVGVSKQALYKWLKDELFLSVLGETVEGYREQMRRLAVRGAPRAMGTLVELQRHEIVRDEEGQEVSRHFVYGAAEARRAANDQLRYAGLEPPERREIGGEGGGPIPLVIEVLKDGD